MEVHIVYMQTQQELSIKQLHGTQSSDLYFPCPKTAVDQDPIVFFQALHILEIVSIGKYSWLSSGLGPPTQQLIVIQKHQCRCSILLRARALWGTCETPLRSVWNLAVRSTLELLIWPVFWAPGEMPKSPIPGMYHSPPEPWAPGKPVKRFAALRYTMQHL